MTGNWDDSDYFRSVTRLAMNRQVPTHRFQSFVHSDKTEASTTGPLSWRKTNTVIMDHERHATLREGQSH